MGGGGGGGRDRRVEGLKVDFIHKLARRSLGINDVSCSKANTDFAL